MGTSKDSKHLSSKSSQPSSQLKSILKQPARTDQTTIEHSKLPSDHINIVVVGSRGVGKTSLVFRLGGGGYNELYFPTHGMDHVKVTVKDHFDEEVKLKIWDTCKYP